MLTYSWFGFLLLVDESQITKALRYLVVVFLESMSLHQVLALTRRVEHPKLGENHTIDILHDLLGVGVLATSVHRVDHYQSLPLTTILFKLRVLGDWLVHHRGGVVLPELVEEVSDPLVCVLHALLLGGVVGRLILGFFVFLIVYLALSLTNLGRIGRVCPVVLICFTTTAVIHFLIADWRSLPLALSWRR